MLAGVVLGVVTLWCVLGLGAALLISRSIRLADERRHDEVRRLQQEHGVVGRLLSGRPFRDESR